MCTFSIYNHFKVKDISEVDARKQIQPWETFICFYSLVASADLVNGSPQEVKLLQKANYVDTGSFSKNSEGSTVMESPS